VRFSTRGVQKHHLKLLGGSPCQKLFTKKNEGKKLFSGHLFLRFFLSRFFAVSLHDELKNTIKMLPKTRPENLKKSQKKVGR
jgi:hypothetical protein